MVDNIEISQIIAFIKAPEKITQDDAVFLKKAIEHYPYFQPLRLLLAKASFGTAEENGALASAALYNDGALLHNFLHEPSALLDTEFTLASSEISTPDSDTVREINDTVVQETESADTQPEGLDEVAIGEVDEQETFDEIAELDIQGYLQVPLPVEEIAEDEIFEEISEFYSEAAHAEPEAAAINEDAKLEQDLVLENIVATDFFAFQDNFQVESVPEIEDQESADADALEDGIVGNDEQVVSKYDDDKLPYTFLWWLAKTRKEHQQIFQPYAAPKQKNQIAQKQVETEQRSDLQQQYVEHIFHIQTPFDAEELVAAPSQPKVSHKGSDIIENFIKNEPQIRVPKAEHINTENKARKSAEDHNDMVTETLAKIYIEQMLYDKAIETYQKLSLKFPEKSRYFADLIQSIEKKI